MKHKLARIGLVSVLVLGLGALGQSAWAGVTPDITPHIVASNGSAPVVMGTSFTPLGAVVLTEWQVGKKKPLIRFHLTADGNGAFTQFGQCDGNHTVRFRAKDVTTGKKSNQSSTSGVCIN
jgi:hypothetical protein